jgi:hypothetical protein
MANSEWRMANSEVPRFALPAHYPLSAHYSIRRPTPTVHYPPFAIYEFALIATRYFLFTIRNSLFAIHYSR